MLTLESSTSASLPWRLTKLPTSPVPRSTSSIAPRVTDSPTDYATTMYPKPPQLFRGKGVTDDSVSESYWKVANGIRLTGMPSFKTKLTDTQVWQVSQLIAHANEISDSVKRALVTDVTTPAPPPGSALTTKDK